MRASTESVHLAVGERAEATLPDVGSGADDVRLRSIVTEHVDFIWRSLRRLGVTEADLADAAQLVFLVLARKLDLVRKGSERAFLFQTALRVASDVRRTRKRRREVPDDLMLDHHDDRPGPDDHAEARLRRAQLDRILDELPLELRAVFVLSEIEELTMAEIAVMTDTPPGTVASRLRRARIQFREFVERLHERERKGAT